MTKTPQSGGMSFRELRLAAGYKTIELAKLLGVSLRTIHNWDNGERPCWGYMQSLSNAFGFDLNSMIEHSWSETVGDHCLCGCGGEKVFPDNPRARHLYTKSACTRCGKIRIYGPSRHHRALCPSCPRKGPRVELTCRGYRPYGARTPRFAKKHVDKGVKLRSYLKYYRTVAEGEYMCRACNGALQMTYGEAKRVRGFLNDASRAYLNSSTELKRYFYETAGFLPHHQAPTIRSLKQLKTLQKTCYKLTYKNELGQDVVFQTFNPKTPKRLPKLKESVEKNIEKTATKRRTTVWRWKRPVLPKTVHGLCLFPDCGKLLLSHETKIVR